MQVMISRSKRLSARAATPIGTTQAVPKKYNQFLGLLGFGAKMRRMEPWVDMMDGAQGINPGFLSAVLDKNYLGIILNILTSHQPTLPNFRKIHTL